MNLPSNPEAESMVLGSILFEPKIIEDVLDILNPDDFLYEKNQDMLRAIQKLYVKSEPIEIVTVSQEMDKLDIAYVSEMAEIPTSASWEHYANEVKDCSIRRTGMTQALKIVERYQDRSEEIADIIDDQQRDALSLNSISSSSFTGMDTLAADSLTRYRLSQNGKIDPGLPTRIKMLDRITGGFAPKFIIIAGRPGQGKTALAVSIAHNMLKANIKVGIFSLEMDKEEIFDRMISQSSEVTARKLTTKAGLNADQWTHVIEAAEYVSDFKLVIDDAGGLDIKELKRRCRQMAKAGCKIIFIDQLSKIKAKGKDLYERNTNAVNQLATLKKELGIPIVLLAQINRVANTQGKKIEPPQLHHLKATGSLEEDADIVLLVHRQGEYEKDNPHVDQTEALLDIAKHRGGPTATVKLNWDGKLTQFSDRGVV